MTTSTSSSTKTFICTLPPPGIADPNLSPDLNYKNSRKRIAIPSQEGNTCLFAVLERMSFFVGNDPQIANHPMRQMELVILKAKEDMIKIDEEVTWKKECADWFSSHYKQVIDKTFVQNYIHSNENEAPSVLSFFREFLENKEFDDLQQFATRKYSKKIVELSKQVFGSFDRIRKIQKEEVTNKETDETINSWMSQGTSFDLAALRIFGVANLHILTIGARLKSFFWHPTLPLASLIEEIDKKGPLVVSGKFGKGYYKEEPFQLKEKISATVMSRIERGVIIKDVVERTLWGWKPNAERKEKSDLHFIILVGARSKVEKDKKIEHVYFIDPLDPSDPENYETQKIYVMSLDRLRNDIFTLTGSQILNEKTNKPMISCTRTGELADYVVHGDPEINYL